MSLEPIVPNANGRGDERNRLFTTVDCGLSISTRMDRSVIADKAVMLARQYYDNSSAAYAVAGQAKAVSGDLVGADTDLEVAESSERKALDTPVGRAERSMFTSTLKSLLTLHAQVLTALGKPADAQKKRDEASTL